MECVGQVEKDEYCLAVLAHHWPTVKRIADIYDVTESDFGAVELICGGFPCQPFSLAGKRGGANDDRYLWPEMLRVIKAYRPAWVLGENVAGIVGVELDKVLADLENEGYELQPFIIPACAVDSPHERKRVWIVAHAKHDGRNGTEKPECACSRIGASPEPVRTEQFTGSSCGAGGAENVADSALMRMERVGESRLCQSSGLVEEIVFDGRCQKPRAAEWEPEPDVGRLADGIPNRVAQLRALGNAVVPQVVEEIGRCIIEAERTGTICAGRAAAGTLRKRPAQHTTAAAQNTAGH